MPSAPPCCAAVLRDCELLDKANQMAGPLTLLDRKRLELARALASSPKLLLRDEIAGGRTDDEGKQLVAPVRRIRDSGVTIVWIEHVLHALLAVADRIMVLNFGEKIAEGLPVPERRRLFTGMSVEDNLRVAIDHAGRKRDWTLARVYARFPILQEKRQPPVQSLSGGQQQLVAIGRALLNQPRVLLCDEISLGLAPKMIREIYAALPEIRAAGTAMVLVEQDVGLAKSASDRLHCMLEGRVTLTGTSADISREAIQAAYFGASHAVA